MLTKQLGTGRPLCSNEYYKYLLIYKRNAQYIETYRRRSSFPPSWKTGPHLSIYTVLCETSVNFTIAIPVNYPVDSAHF